MTSLTSEDTGKCVFILGMPFLLRSVLTKINKTPKYSNYEMLTESAVVLTKVSRF